MEASTQLLSLLFGRAIASAIDHTQVHFEKNYKLSYDNAVEVWRGVIDDKSSVIQTYTNDSGYVLKLVADGVCTRQVQTRNGGVMDVNFDSVVKGMKKLGVTMTGLEFNAIYFENYGKVKHEPPVITQRSASGATATFQVFGGMSHLHERTVVITIDGKATTGKVDDGSIRELAEPFTEFVKME
jgi:hypothetical protein